MTTTRPSPSVLDAHAARNRLHTFVLAAGSLLLLGLSAFTLLGPSGVVWVGLLGAVSLYFATRVSPSMVLRLYKAVPLPAAAGREIHLILREVSRRAGLPRPPRLMLVRSQLMNAFAVGRPDDSAIAITDTLARALTQRELAGVLAHEVSHIAAGDLRVMALADMVSRMTSAMATLGMVMLVFNLPSILTGAVAVSHLGILILMLSPTLGGLMQLALSRAREYDADRAAVALTGDARGLAAALVKLEKYQGGLWERLALPGGRVPDPSLLRSHPRTEDRVARLLAFEEASEAPPLAMPDEAPGYARSPVPRIPRPRPHVRALGLYY